MTDPVSALIQRHQSRGILVDSNILLLFFMGGFDRELIPRFKRTQQFVPEDYDLLTRLLSRFSSVITTPNILSEVNSLSGQLGEPVKTQYFDVFAQGISVLDERYVASSDVAQLDQFPKLGLTDTGILHLARNEYLVLTDDFRLAQHLAEAGIAVLNFNQLRPRGWT